MNCIVVYKSRYGATKAYGEWIADRLGCKAVDAKGIKAKDLLPYDTVIFGGGLYAEIIAGVTLITKNIDILKGKKIIVFTTGITPLDLREYYDGLVMKKNFKDGIDSHIRVFNFLGKMILSELSPVHRAAIKTLKKLMKDKENPTEMEKLLVGLCDCDGDFTDESAIDELVAYAKEIQGGTI